MASIHVKQWTPPEGHAPRVYAEVGDTVAIRAPRGCGLVAATLETTAGDRVTVRHLHNDKVVEMTDAKVVGLFQT